PRRADRRCRERRERRAGEAAGVDVGVGGAVPRRAAGRAADRGGRVVTGAPSEVDALQTTLAAEHAAVYVLGLIGSRASETAEPGLYRAVRAAYDAHRDSRDTLISAIAAQGATPSPAAAAYTPPPGLDTPDGRYEAALALERSCAATYAA